MHCLSCLQAGSDKVSLSTKKKLKDNWEGQRNIDLHGLRGADTGIYTWNHVCYLMGTV